MARDRVVVIKKYGNRRLYDTEDSRYLTQEELSDKIRAGADVRVVDARTGEDLTQATLTQIIIEGRGAHRLLPVSLLVQLIRMGDDALAEFLGRYVSSALELYMRAKRQAEQIAPYNPFATLPFAATDAIARLFMTPMAAGREEAAPAPAPPAPPPPAPEQTAAEGDVAQLRRELEELKRAVAGDSSSSSRPRRRRAAPR